LAPLQTDPRFLGLLKEEEEEEEETPGSKNLRVHLFEQRTSGKKNPPDLFIVMPSKSKNRWFRVFVTSSDPGSG
jgi:hypothetical protein